MPLAIGSVAEEEVNQFIIPEVVEANIVVVLFLHIGLGGVMEIIGVLFIVATIAVCIGSAVYG